MRISSLQRRDVPRSEVEVESAWRGLAGSWLPSISLPASKKEQEFSYSPSTM